MSEEMSTFLRHDSEPYYIRNLVLFVLEKLKNPNFIIFNTLK